MDTKTNTFFLGHDWFLDCFNISPKKIILKTEEEKKIPLVCAL